MKHLAIAFVFFATLSAGGATAQALHCQNRVVSVGDPTSRVRSLCGEPTDVVQRTETRARAVHRRGPGGSIVSDSVAVTVQLEQWTYDFGPSRFVRVLVFEDGRLVRIDTLGYGTPGHSGPPS